MAPKKPSRAARKAARLQRAGPRVQRRVMKVPRAPKSILGEVFHLPLREESLGSFSTSVAFANTTFVLNAANNVTFPWLAPIAAKFEYYRFNRLELEFRTTSLQAVSSTNTAAGSVLVNVNYDVLDAAFTTRIQMEDYGGGFRMTEVAPYETDVHRIEPSGFKGGVAGGWRLNLVSSAQTAATVPYPTSSSAHDYDIGLLQVASEGAQAASVAGRLIIRYQVDLCNPKLDTPLNQSVLAAHYSASSATSAATAAAPISVVSQVSGSTLAITRLSGTTFALPQVGRYQCELLWFTGSNNIAAVPTVTATTAATLVTNQNVSTVSSTGLFLASGASASLIFTVDISSVTNVITIGGLTGMSNANLDINVQVIPSGLTLSRGAAGASEGRITDLEKRLSRVLSMLSSADLVEDSDEYEDAHEAFPVACRRFRR